MLDTEKRWQQLNKQIGHYAHKFRMLEPGDRVLVAVSGGADSLLLLHWLHTQQQPLSLHIMVAHYHHSFRGQEADDDERAVHRFCADRHLPCLSQKGDVSAYAREHKRSKQVAARECRYHFFDEMIRQHQMNKLALGHHADDQIETILMRFVRGAGLTGLAGISPVRRAEGYEMIRPLLTLDKDQIVSGCRLLGFSTQNDSSNKDKSMPRNLVRHDIVPHLKQMNPHLPHVVQDMSELLQEEDRYLQQMAKLSMDEVIVSSEESLIIVSAKKLRQSDIALQRRVILLLLSYINKSSRDLWQRIHIDQIIKLVQHQGAGSKYLDLPQSIVVSVVYDELRIAKQTRSLEKKSKQNQAFFHKHNMKAFRSDYDYKMPIDNNIHVRFSIGQLFCEQIELAEDQGLIKNLTTELAGTSSTDPLSNADKAFVALFDIDEMLGPLQLRNRRQGDRMTLLGMTGSKKVKDIFIDSKIEPAKRQLWPIIADQKQILWLPGIKRSSGAPLTNVSRHVLKVTVLLDEEDRQSHE